MNTRRTRLRRVPLLLGAAPVQVAVCGLRPGHRVAPQAVAQRLPAGHAAIPAARLCTPPVHQGTGARPDFVFYGVFIGLELRRQAGSELIQRTASPGSEVAKGLSRMSVARNAGTGAEPEGFGTMSPGRVAGIGAEASRGLGTMAVEQDAGPPRAPNVHQPCSCDLGLHLGEAAHCRWDAGIGAKSGGLSALSVTAA